MIFILRRIVDGLCGVLENLEMIIKKIKLENIRSYLNQEIEFPNGSILLSGDIGSGKSTVLLAIDFALFGLRRRGGNSLLRTGKNSGGVEVCFGIDGKNVVVKRTLKRRGDAVVQDSGFIVIDGVKKVGTAIEIKKAILDLLNYPKDMLMKNKSLVYKYTVYIPQGEMHEILSGDKDIRLDTLRKVFGIDKYKRIRENVEKFIFMLRGKIKEFSGMIFDLEDKIKELEEKKEMLKGVLENIKKIGSMESEILRVKREINELEKRIRKLEELRRDLQVNEANLRSKKEQKVKVENELKSLVIEEVEEVDVSEFRNKEKEISERLMGLSSEIKLLESKKGESERIRERMMRLSICPVCKREVSDVYKETFVNSEMRKIQGFVDRISALNEESAKLKEKLEGVRDKIRELRELEIKRIKNEEKKKLKKRLEKLNEELSNSLSVLEKEREILIERLRDFKDVEESYNFNKKKLEELIEREKEFQIKKAGLEREADNLKIMILKLEDEVSKKIKIKENLEILSRLKDWLEKEFCELVMMIEKKTMFKVYNDFNSLFKRWFNILVDDLSVNLDKEFNPVVEQDGYEIDFRFLSGGEKSSVSLAYRLALNQVINSLVSDIRTSDLLMLDEPTDGFSSEQLDRLGVILRELKLKQVLIVSHESKIESFVDHIIRFRKEGHVSFVEN